MNGARSARNGPTADRDTDLYTSAYPIETHTRRRSATDEEDDVSIEDELDGFLTRAQPVAARTHTYSNNNQRSARRSTQYVEERQAPPPAKHNAEAVGVATAASGIDPVATRTASRLPRGGLRAHDEDRPTRSIYPADMALAADYGLHTVLCTRTARSTTSTLTSSSSAPSSSSSSADDRRIEALTSGKNGSVGVIPSRETHRLVTATTTAAAAESEEVIDSSSSAASHSSVMGSNARASTRSLDDATERRSDVSETTEESSEDDDDDFNDKKSSDAWHLQAMNTSAPCSVVPLASLKDTHELHRLQAPSKFVAGAATPARTANKGATTGEDKPDRSSGKGGSGLAHSPAAPLMMEAMDGELLDIIRAYYERRQQRLLGHADSHEPREVGARDAETYKAQAHAGTASTAATLTTPQGRSSQPEPNFPSFTATAVNRQLRSPSDRHAQAPPMTSLQHVPLPTAALAGAIHRPSPPTASSAELGDSHFGSAGGEGVHGMSGVSSPSPSRLRPAYYQDGHHQSNDISGLFSHEVDPRRRGARGLAGGLPTNVARASTMEAPMRPGAGAAGGVGGGAGVYEPSDFSQLPSFSATSFVRAYVSDINLSVEPALVVTLLAAALNIVVVMFLQHHVLDTRDHLGLFLIGSYLIFASYYMVYYFLERFSSSFRRIASNDKKFYIIGNLLKAGILVSITPFAMYHLTRIIVFDKWESNILRNLGCIYAIPDLISMIIVKRMRWSTWIHHLCVVAFNYFSILNDYQQENVCRCVVVYAAFSSFAYCVNVLLASRFLGVSVSVARVLSFVALVVYVLCCAINWIWQVYYLRRLIVNGNDHWTVYVYMGLICLVMWDDVVLNRWLLHNAKSTAFAAAQQLKQPATISPISSVLLSAGVAGTSASTSAGAAGGGSGGGGTRATAMGGAGGMRGPMGAAHAGGGGPAAVNLVHRREGVMPGVRTS